MRPHVVTSQMSWAVTCRYVPGPTLLNQSANFTGLSVGCLMNIKHLNFIGFCKVITSLRLMPDAFFNFIVWNRVYFLSPKNDLLRSEWNITVRTIFPFVTPLERLNYSFSVWCLQQNMNMLTLLRYQFR